MCVKALDHVSFTILKLLERLVRYWDQRFHLEVEIISMFQVQFSPENHQKYNSNRNWNNECFRFMVRVKNNVVKGNQSEWQFTNPAHPTVHLFWSEPLCVCETLFT